MMTERIARLIDQLVADPWRTKVGFSEDIAVANEALYATAREGASIEPLMDEWLLKYQPCLFGRIGARLHSLTYCVLNDADLQDSDESINLKIQKDRARWKRAGYAGESSAFVIVVVSPVIANATPDSAMLELARRLCQLYLVADDIEPDQIYVDHLGLEVPVGPARRGELTFDVGVNYFCAQADRRWWHDHRIPGGMAFSMNSVGHLVRSAILTRAMDAASIAVLGSAEDVVDPKVDSLEKALVLAMRTISNAAEAVSGKATQLLEAKDKDSGTRCPFNLPRAIADFDCHSYSGYYHTDMTLPSEYFQPAVDRPPNVAPRLLDFSYLYDDRLDNPAYARMGVGVRTRGESKDSTGNKGSVTSEAMRKRPRARGRQQ
jgi:hypothetical protein